MDQLVRRAAGRPPVPPDRIVAMALRIVDEEGADALSMRALAEHLGWICGRSHGLRGLDVHSGGGQAAELAVGVLEDRERARTLCRPARFDAVARA
ncbi:hypothetical protein ACQ86D_32705 [Streptomyces galilaeus]